MPKGIFYIIGTLVWYFFWDWVSIKILTAMFKDWDKTMVYEPNWAFLRMGLVIAFTIGSVIGLAKLLDSKHSQP